MTEVKDGGPAFPVPSEDSGPGMSLRDWFAGQALIDFSDAYTGFAKRLFYALSGFNHDANFVPSSSPTVI